MKTIKKRRISNERSFLYNKTINKWRIKQIQQIFNELDKIQLYDSDGDFYYLEEVDSYKKIKDQYLKPREKEKEDGREK